MSFLDSTTFQFFITKDAINFFTNFRRFVDIYERTHPIEAKSVQITEAAFRQMLIAKFLPYPEQRDRQLSALMGNAAVSAFYNQMPESVETATLRFYMKQSEEGELIFREDL